VSTGGETIGVAEVQLRVGGAPGFDRAMSAAGASTRALGTEIMTTAQQSQSAWAKIVAGPTVAQRMGGMPSTLMTPAFPSGGGNLPDSIRKLMEGEHATPGPSTQSQAGYSPNAPLFGWLGKPGATSSASKGIKDVTQSAHGLDEAQKQTSLSGRATAIVMSRMSASASELALAMNETENREAAMRSALVASTADITGAIAMTAAMTGTVEGLALGMTISLVPALVRGALSLEDFNEKMKSTKRVTSDVVELIDRMSKQKETGIAAKEAAETDSFEAMAKKRQKIVQEMDVQSEKAKRLTGPAGKAFADAVNLNAPGRFTATLQEAGDIARDVASHIPYFGRSVETSDSTYVKNQRFDMKGLFRDLGSQIVKESGVNPQDKEALRKLGNFPTLLWQIIKQQSPSQIAEEIGRQAYEDQLKGGPARVTDKMLFNNLSPAKKNEIRNQLGLKEGEEPSQAQIDRINKDLQDKRAELQQTTSNAMSQFNESQLKDADPRKYQKMLIERDRLKNENWLKDMGVGPGAAEYGINNQIASRKTEQVDRGDLAGVMNVASLHDAIQNMLAKNDDARQTAINTKEMATTLKQMQERGQFSLTSHPDGPPAKLVR
jgi:hypothetical protein